MKLISLFLFIMVVLLSCQRKGCTEPTALNYDYKAKKDDGSCLPKDSTFSYETIQILSSSMSGTNILIDLPGVEIDYHVVNMTEIYGDFYIEPGVNITFAEGAGFRFEGNVYINGTQESNINFLPSNVRWKGISFMGGLKDIDIDYLNVTGVGTAGSPAQNYDSFWAVNLFYYQNAVTINNLTIKDCQYGGLQFSLSFGSSPVIDVDSIRIENCNIPLRIDHYAFIDQLNNIEFINNTNNHILLPIRSQGYNVDLHFLNYNIPYYLSTNESSTKSINMQSNAIVVDSGTEFLMGEYAQIYSNGNFIASGLVTDSVIFKGYLPLGGYWKGLSLSKGATNSLIMDYTVMKNTNDNNSGMTVSGSGNVTFTNSVLDGGSFCGITSNVGVVIDSTNSVFTAITPICQ